MIVDIGGTQVNPAHVVFIEADGPDRSLLHLTTGKYVTASLSRKDAARAVNDAEAEVQSTFAYRIGLEIGSRRF